METELDLKWKLGVRTAALIVKITGGFTSSVRFERESLKGSGKSLMEVLLILGTAKAGARFRITVVGPDADVAMEKLRDLFTYGPQVDRCPEQDCDGEPILLDYSKTGGTEYVCKKGHVWGIVGWPDKPEKVTPHGGRTPFI